MIISDEIDLILRNLKGLDIEEINDEYFNNRFEITKECRSDEKTTFSRKSSTIVGNMLQEFLSELKGYKKYGGKGKDFPEYEMKTVKVNRKKDGSFGLGGTTAILAKTDFLTCDNFYESLFFEKASKTLFIFYEFIDDRAVICDVRFLDISNNKKFEEDFYLLREDILSGRKEVKHYNIFELKQNGDSIHWRKKGLKNYYNLQYSESFFDENTKKSNLNKLLSLINDDLIDKIQKDFPETRNMRFNKRINLSNVSTDKLIEELEKRKLYI